METHVLSVSRTLHQCTFCLLLGFKWRTSPRLHDTKTHSETKILYLLQQLYSLTWTPFWRCIYRIALPTTVEHTSSYLSDAFSRSLAAAPPKNRASSRGSTSSLQHSGCEPSAGQNVHISAAPVLCGAELLTLGIFTFLWVQKGHVSGKCRNVILISIGKPLAYIMLPKWWYMN